MRVSKILLMDRILHHGVWQPVVAAAATGEGASVIAAGANFHWRDQKSLYGVLAWTFPSTGSSIRSLFLTVRTVRSRNRSVYSRTGGGPGGIWVSINLSDENLIFI